jgi:glycosyltransferase involved in cell wall biosynthesis
MKSDLLVSIVMPVYNSEAFLKKSVRSATEQTLDSIEIICINDQSSDGSLAVLKELQKKDRRIRIINNNKNVGPGESRNIGIKKATGKYICFLDSDDWLEKTACEILYNKAVESGSDVVFIKPKLVFKNKTILDDRLLTKEDVLDKEIVFRKNLLRKVAWAPWSKFVSRSMLLKNKILFPDIYIAEDMDFSYKSLYYAKKISYVEEYLYNYNLRENSLMSYTRPRRRIENYFESIKLLEKFLKEKKIFEKYYREFVLFKLYNYSAVYGVMYYSNENIDKKSYQDPISVDNDFGFFKIIKFGIFNPVVISSILIKLKLFNFVFRIREFLRLLFGKWGKRNS